MVAVSLVVVGVGDFGQLHAAAAAGLPDVSLIGVVDIDEQRGASVAAQVDTRLYGSLQAALEDGRPDGVVIATPENVHVPQVLDSLAAGVHVLVEKPVALSSEEIRRLEEAAAQTARVVLPGHISRYLPEVQHLLADPGEVWSIIASRLVPKTRRALHGRIHPAWMAMIHDLDLVAALLPEGPIRVAAAERRTEGAARYPDLCWAMIEVEGGPVALIENAWLYPHDRQYIDARLRVMSSDRMVEISLPSDAMVVVRADGEHRPGFAIDARLAGRPVGALAAQLQHFVDVIEGRAEPLVTLADARRATRLAEAVIEAASSGHVVSV